MTEYQNQMQIEANKKLNAAQKLLQDARQDLACTEARLEYESVASVEEIVSAVCQSLYEKEER